MCNQQEIRSQSILTTLQSEEGKDTPKKGRKVGKPCELATLRRNSQMTKNHVKHMRPLSYAELSTNVGFSAKLSSSHLTKEDTVPKAKIYFETKGKAALDFCG